jgi:hypothetical protein
VARAQTDAQPGTGLEQLARKAGQSSALRSSCQSGSVDQSTGTHRARPLISGAVVVWLPAASAGAGGWSVAGIGCRGSGGRSDKRSDKRSVGAVAQALSKASAAADRAGDNRNMWLILLEALGALLLLILIVWWTMFSGRQRGARSSDDEPPR